ncbi:hypothetical protein [uncultured Methylobacterium sp.]|uniref:hypothetical protein n=1 Tax=uncultured Methylobacterium sp. TaxID=157278 RepID=UPI002591C6B8|nr:hypothetical protein [uncultured Methylobacterium sp.]
MSDISATYDDQEDAWPVEEVIKFGRAHARTQQKRLQEYITETNPALSKALTTEAARFDVVRRETIAPTMRAFADEAIRRGWHVFVIYDDDLDRLDYLATPGIRFYCSRRPSLLPVGDLIWPPSFVGFCGCAQTGLVRTYVEFIELGANVESFRGERPLAYPDVSSEAVRAVLVAFLGELERVGAASERADDPFPGTRRQGRH